VRRTQRHAEHGAAGGIAVGLQKVVVGVVELVVATDDPVALAVELAGQPELLIDRLQEALCSDS